MCNKSVAFVLIHIFGDFLLIYEPLHYRCIFVLQLFAIALFTSTMSATIDHSSVEIISQVQKSPNVRLFTGNIQRHPELFRQLFKNSSEELVAALEHQLDGPNGPELEIRLVII